MTCSFFAIWNYKRMLVKLNSCNKLSLGDARAYYLSTTKNELGVVSAQSIAGTSRTLIHYLFHIASFHSIPCSHWQTYVHEVSLIHALKNLDSVFMSP